MKYEMMFPDQIRKAIKDNTPVVLPVGVIEYHSEHLVVGVDTLLIIRALEIIEKEMDVVILPPFYYGAASYGVEPPENNGTIHIPGPSLFPFAKGLFNGLLRIGFRNIHIFIHHQSENFVQGMPTDLAFKFAARQSIFEFIEANLGEGWWGKESSKDYYTQQEKGQDPFNWIKIHPFITEEIQKKFPIDHAGKQETSLMLTFCPDGVDMKKFDESKWYSKTAKEASLEYIKEAREEILSDIKKILKN
ncbi:MAG TPA: creatininase family protein [bacterium]|nr:creatininase family protein [bacterium]